MNRGAFSLLNQGQNQVTYMEATVVTVVDITKAGNCEGVQDKG